MKNKYDVFVWVKKVAESARTKPQIVAAMKLVRNFKHQFLFDSKIFHPLYLNALNLETDLRKRSI